MRYFIFFVLAIFFTKSYSQLTPFEISKGKETATYHQIIEFYKILSEKNSEITITEIGKTDIGKPLSLVKIAKVNSGFNKCKVLINNGIHPGEPEGIDASMMFARDIFNHKKLNKLLDKVDIYLIPVYNIDGCLNRNSSTRANQNGPIEYGFRGNAKNLDLNRDFIKCDSKNAELFELIFQSIKPDLYIETHTSNGADYQYTLTYIPTQKDKLNQSQGQYFEKVMIPSIAALTKDAGFEMTPFVNTRKVKPDDGIDGFFDNPRYSTGYASLFNTLGFMVETHMLKAFDKRVKATYTFLSAAIEIAYRDAENIIQLHAEADSALFYQQEFPLTWKQDTSNFELLNFKGYKAKYIKSKISGFDRLFYDRSKPMYINVKYYNKFVPNLVIKKPAAYVIPQAYQSIIKLLQINQVEMYELTRDTTIIVECYQIDSLKTLSKPYEGHYYHSKIFTSKKTDSINYFKGDKIIITDQKSNKYLIETLEPEGNDSFMDWNFFDAILNHKEEYSDYVFEDLALEILKNDPILKADFENKKFQDKAFASNPTAQLDFIYHRSKFHEKTYNRYPVARILFENLIPTQILSY